MILSWHYLACSSNIKCSGILPGLVRLDLSIGGGLVLCGDGEDGFGVVPLKSSVLHLSVL